MLQINVRKADAGATRLTSPQERAVSKQKKLNVRQARPNRKNFSLNTRTITASKPCLERSASMSPTGFMAAESMTSPALDESTSTPIAVHSLNQFMDFLRHLFQILDLGLSQRRTARYQSDAEADEQHARPSPCA